MSSNYTGNPSGVQPPSPAPDENNAPIVVLPADGDPLNVASVIQAFKVLADRGAFNSLSAKRLLELVHSQALNDSYLMSLMDHDENFRNFFDHNGYFLTGDVSRCEETWSAGLSAVGSTTNAASFLSDLSWYRNSIAGNSDGNIQRNNTSFGGSGGLFLLPGTANGDVQQLFSGYNIASTQSTHFFLQSFSSIAMEWIGGYVAVGADHLNFEVGFSNNGAGGKSVLIYRKNGNAFWNMYSDNGGIASDIATNVASTSNVFHRFRLELHGTSSPYGKMARFFIDGSHKGDTTIDLPSDNTPLGIRISASSIAAANAASGNIGHIVLSYNHALSATSP